MKPSMGVDFCGVHFKNPVVTASGTFGFGGSIPRFMICPSLAGSVSRGSRRKNGSGTPAENRRDADGNLKQRRAAKSRRRRVFNRGTAFLKTFDTRSSPHLGKYRFGVLLDGGKNLDSDVDLIEMNISCPNVKAGGMAFGTSARWLLRWSRRRKSMRKSRLS
jgi:dihydroorotate dehydrogenase (NAD+) catalytic subunit